VIQSKIRGYIDIEIPYDVLNHLRDSLLIIPVNELYQVTKAIAIVKNEKPLQDKYSKPWGDPLSFPMTEVVSNILPGNRYGHRIEGKTIAETWVKILHLIKTTGTIRPTGYDGKWQELIDLMVIVTDEPENFYFPDPNYLPIDRNYLESYIPQILHDAPYQEGVKYTYGQRLRSWFGKDQVNQVIRKLSGELDSASAVMSLWDSGAGNHIFPKSLQDRMIFQVERYGRELGDSDHDHDNPPCLNHIWLRVVDNELSLTATFRSNDMFSAWVANAMGLRALQRYIRDAIAGNSPHDLTMGPLITISQSAHIYDDCWENVESLISTQYQKIVKKVDFSDRSGNFIIEVSQDSIVVRQTTPGSGDLCRTYSGKSAKDLYQQIARVSPGIQVEHAMYLGTELQKAELAIKHKLDYEQDKTLKLL
jgi:thymidylate synthase